MNRKIGIILSYVLMIMEVLSTLLLTPYIIRQLGQAEYGVFKLSMAINAYLLLLDLGIGNAIIRYVAKYRVEKNHEQQSKFLGVAMVFYLAIAVVAMILGGVLVGIFPSVFARGLSYEQGSLGQRLLSITVINSAVVLGTAPFINVLIAYERFSASKGASIIQIILRMIFTFLAVKSGMGSAGIVTVNLVMTVLCRGFFVYYVFAVLKIKPKFKGMEGSFIKEIIAYSSLILLQMLATQINASVDQVLIGSIVASSAVILAVYGVGTQLVQYFQSIGMAFNGVLMPGIVSLVEKKASSKALLDEMVRVGRIVFMVLVLIWSGFLVCGRQFVVSWAGKDNEQAYLVALILMTAYVFVLTESVGTQILWARSEHKEQSLLKIAIVLLNILLTILLIKWQPLLGATIGTFISLALGDVVLTNIIFVKKLKINLFSYYRRLIKGIIPSAVLTVLLGKVFSMFFSGGWLILGANIVLMVLVYTVAMWLFGMNEYEKRLCLSLVKKMKITVHKEGESK